MQLRVIEIMLKVGINYFNDTHGKWKYDVAILVPVMIIV